MNDELSSRFGAFDRSRLSRRQLLQAVGILALAPASAFAATNQKRGWMAAPPKLPFKPTGWKTVLLDHLSCKAEDHEKEAAFYSALMNWGVRSNNDREAVLEIGDWGGIVIQGGYRVSASEIAAARAQHEREAAYARTKDFDMGPFVPRKVVFDSVCWGIESWDARKVEAALKARGLNPVPDNRGHDFESFHVKDPDGFDVQISNGNRHNRHASPARGKLAVQEPFTHTDWKTVWLDHLSYQCSDYRRTVAFYEALLGWQPLYDFGNKPVRVLSNQVLVRIGNLGDTIIRNRFDGGHGAFIDHISFGIAPFRAKAVRAALEKRGLPAKADAARLGPIDTSPYKSFHTSTPNGFNLQISNANSVNRGSEYVFKSEFPL